MKNQLLKSDKTKCGDVFCGFELIKKEYAATKNATLYTLKHIKTGAELFYFDRADENKTFAISFKTLPEDSTGVFHILEHSVLNGSEKYPVKEPFVSMLQSSMQTFLNAMTYSDKTVFPVSSRNEQDFYNLMSVYLDAVFCPMIYNRPEIFMQEGWHYEFDEETGEPYYNGVVFSEMKGAYSDVDRVIEEGTNKLLFKDTCYGFSSGGDPENITDLSYEKFVATHKRFYHPSNSAIVLDGQMDIDHVLKFIDEEYLSKYEQHTADFDFEYQPQVTGETTVYYEAVEGEEELSHMAVSKILCNHDDTEKIYAAKILSDYLTATNESPLKRAFLENGLAQDISLFVDDEIYQPSMLFLVRNTNKANFDEIKTFLPSQVKKLAESGLDKEMLLASIEKFAFTSKEITEPYGVELALKILGSRLYGDDPLTHIENFGIFESLKQKVDTNYFESLLEEMLLSTDDKVYLYALPSLTKGEENEQKEREKILSVSGKWSDSEKAEAIEKYQNLRQWQQSPDSEEVLMTLPHLELSDVPKTAKLNETHIENVAGTNVLKVEADTNSIVYVNLYFDVSDFSEHQLKILNVLSGCMGELSTKRYSAAELQTKIKKNLGRFETKIDVFAKNGEIDSCKPYLIVSFASLEENISEALELVGEMLLNGRYDETDRIYDIIMQSDYFLKQSLIGEGHIYAITKSLSPFSKESAVKETVGGETFVRWFSDFAEKFSENAQDYSTEMSDIASKVFIKDRLFTGFSGKSEFKELESLINALPNGNVGESASYSSYDAKACAVEIPAGVGYSSFGHNLYALGGSYNGACVVLSALMTFGYLWNEVRVQGGAYGTGMNIRSNGDVFCYSYRDPDMENTRSAVCSIPEFLEEVLSQGIQLDDIIIGAVNNSDPLTDPAGICETECMRYLKGISHDEVNRIREEILNTTPDDLADLIKLLKEYTSSGKFCVIGDKNSIEFVNND